MQITVLSENILDQCPNATDDKHHIVIFIYAKCNYSPLLESLALISHPIAITGILDLLGKNPHDRV